MDADNLDLLSRKDFIRLLTLSHQSVTCTTQEQLTKLVLDLRELFAFENAVCAQAKIPDAFMNPDVRVEMLDISYPADYMKLYFENDFHMTDAVVCDFMTNLSPVNWLKLDQQYGYNYPAAVLAMDFNMKEGWSYGTVDLATMTCTLFSMGGPRTDNDLRAQKILEYIIPFYSAAYTRVLGNAPGTITVLSKKEVEVLHWIKEGKSSWEISVILNCSNRTVNFHVNNIKTKLQALTRAQAVAIGLQHKIISF